MIRLNWLEKSYASLKWVAIIAGGIATFQGFWTGWKSEDFQGIRQLLLFANEWSSWISIPSLTILSGVCVYVKTHFGSIQMWKTVTHILEEYRDVVFSDNGDLSGDGDHLNRVTLFRHTNFRLAFCYWPWTNWVVPVARTGHATHVWKIPRFRSPLSSPDTAEGIAGVAFANNSTIEVNDLPDLGKSASKKNKRDYARKAFVTLEFVDEQIKRGSCKSRSMVGIPIEVLGKPWGVIVVDSRNPRKIIDRDHVESGEFARLARTLSKLLED